VEAGEGWELVAPVPFSTVVFRRTSPTLDPEAQDALNMALMHAVNETGEVFLSHTRLNGRIALRLSMGNLRTEARHLERSWELLEEHAERLEEDPQAWRPRPRQGSGRLAGLIAWSRPGGVPSGAVRGRPQASFTSRASDETASFASMKSMKVFSL
jgi:hypothetical protein